MCGVSSCMFLLCLDVLQSVELRWLCSGCVSIHSSFVSILMSLSILIMMLMHFALHGHWVGE